MFDYNVGYYDPNLGIWIGVGGGSGPRFPGGGGMVPYYPPILPQQNQQILFLGLIVLGAFLLMKD